MKENPDQFTLRSLLALTFWLAATMAGWTAVYTYWRHFPSRAYFAATVSGLMAGLLSPFAVIGAILGDTVKGLRIGAWTVLTLLVMYLLLVLLLS